MSVALRTEGLAGRAPNSKCSIRAIDSVRRHCQSDFDSTFAPDKKVKGSGSVFAGVGTVELGAGSWNGGQAAWLTCGSKKTRSARNNAHSNIFDTQ